MQSKEYKNFGPIRKQDCFLILRKPKFINLLCQHKLLLHLKFYSVLMLRIFSNTNIQICNFCNFNFGSFVLCHSSNLLMFISLCLLCTFLFMPFVCFVSVKNSKTFHKILCKFHVVNTCSFLI